jgi:hypothetical protein
MPRTGIYVPLDACYYLDDAVMDVSAHAELLYVRGLAACRQHLTDGLITRSRLVTLTAKLKAVPRLVDELVAHHLWVAEPEGWRIRSWLEHNDSVERIMAKREAAATRKAKWNASRDASGTQPQDVARGSEEGEAENSLAPAEPSPEDASPSDDLWDAVMTSCGIDVEQITDAAIGGYRKAVASIRARGATPDDVWARARVYGRKFPTAALTPHALAKHWAELVPPPAKLVLVRDENCEECSGTGFVLDEDERAVQCKCTRPEAAHG